MMLIILLLLPLVNGGEIEVGFHGPRLHSGNHCVCYVNIRKELANYCGMQRKRRQYSQKKENREQWSGLLATRDFSM